MDDRAYMYLYPHAMTYIPHTFIHDRALIQNNIISSESFGYLLVYVGGMFSFPVRSGSCFHVLFGVLVGISSYYILFFIFY